MTHLLDGVAQWLRQSLVTWFLASIFCLAIMSQAEIKAADDLILWSWSNTSSNGQYVVAFVSQTPLEEQIADLRKEEDDPPYFIVNEWEQQMREAHNRFPTSGMYRNNGSQTPLWTLEPGGWLFGHPTNDGKRLVSFCDEFDDFLVVNVIDSNGDLKSLHDWEVLMPAMVLRWIAGTEQIEVYDCTLNTAEDAVIVTTSCDDTLVISLDDFRIRRSDATLNAVFNLFNTVQGIAFVVFVVMMVSGLIWSICGWWTAPKRRAC
ncbi:MAG: hypothetical protein ACR2NU_16800 [Aeoliella sp.]